MKEDTLIRKLEDIVRNGKSKTIKIDKKPYYISRKLINECKKEGGLLPLAALIPLIATGLTAATGAATGIAKTVIDKKAKDNELAEQKRHNLAMEKKQAGSAKTDNDKKAKDDELPEQRRHNLAMEKKQAGRGLKDAIKNYVQNLPYPDEDRKKFKKIFKLLSKVSLIESKGDGLFLGPYAK